MERRIRELLERFEKVEELLSHPDVLANQKQYRELTQEHSYLSEVKETCTKIQDAEKHIEEDEKLLKIETDPELLEMIRGEITSYQTALPKLRLNSYVLGSGHLDDLACKGHILLERFLRSVDHDRRPAGVDAALYEVQIFTVIQMQRDRDV